MRVRLEHGNAPVGVDLSQEFGSPRLTLPDVIFAAIECEAEKSGCRAIFVEFPRRRIFGEEKFFPNINPWGGGARGPRHGRGPFPRPPRATAAGPPFSSAN